MNTLILGMGNELFGDDAVGIHVVYRLRELLEKEPEACAFLENSDLLECTISGLRILDVVEGYDRVILIDTIKKEKPITGTITILRGQELRHIPGPSPHYVSIPQALEIGRLSGIQVPDRIDIIAVEAKDLYRMGEQLSQEMVDAIPEIIHKIKGLLEDA